MPTTGEDIVGVALEQGLDAIVVTDHNSVEWVDHLRLAAERNGLAVFPGFELSVRGGHLLGLFEQDVPLTPLRRLVERLGFSEDKWGDGFAQSPVWLDDVAREIVTLGGLAIAAHIDREPRGFIVGMESRADKQRIHASEYLSALEITDPRGKEGWNRGLMTFYPTPRACIQGSDAHAPAEVGRRPVFLRLERLDLDGIRLAFREYEFRIRFPYELETEEALPL